MVSRHGDDVLVVGGPKYVLLFGRWEGTRKINDGGSKLWVSCEQVTQESARVPTSTWGQSVIAVCKMTVRCLRPVVLTKVSSNDERRRVQDTGRIVQNRYVNKYTGPDSTDNCKWGRVSRSALSALLVLCCLRLAGK